MHCIYINMTCHVRTQLACIVDIQIKKLAAAAAELVAETSPCMRHCRLTNYFLPIYGAASRQQQSPARQTPIQARALHT
jgi:hypothetical protein